MHTTRFTCRKIGKKSTPLCRKAAITPLVIFPRLAESALLAAMLLDALPNPTLCAYGTHCEKKKKKLQLPQTTPDVSPLIRTLPLALENEPKSSTVLVQSRQGIQTPSASPVLGPPACQIAPDAEPSPRLQLLYKICVAASSSNAVPR